MYRFEQRRDPARLMWRRIWAGVLFILVIIGLNGVWKVYNKELESRTLRIEAEAKLAELEKREAELRTDISNLKSDRGMEAELRERYDLARAGEGVVVIVDPPAPPPEPQPTTYQRVKAWFSW